MKANKIFLNDEIIDNNGKDLTWEKQFIEMVNQEKENIIAEQVKKKKKKHKHMHKHRDAQR